MSNIEIKEENGMDLVTYTPSGVCSKLMLLKIKNDIVLDAEFIGGCSGNLGGIKMLIQGLSINDVINKLSNINCGAKGTSCPDQLAQGLRAYLEVKQGVKI